MNTSNRAYPVQFAIKLTVRAPFNTAASEPGIHGLDAPLLRDHRGRPLIPGSLLQGRMVEELINWGAGAHFRDLASRQGSAATENSGNQPQRKTLVLGDLVLEAAPQASEHITRISLQAATRTAVPGALQILETPAASGAPLCFVGSAHAFVTDDKEAQALCQQLQIALRLIPSIGAERSIGFGQVTAAAVEPMPLTRASSTGLHWPGIDNHRAKPAAAVDIALQFDRPIVVTDAPLSTNSFEATDSIAGNVLKGVFADTCVALGLELPPRLADIVFHHAFCAARNDRPRVNPASLVEADLQNEKPLLDLATCSHPVLLQKNNGISAPRFALDWKYDDDAAIARDATLATEFGRAIPRRQLRVRTAIDPHTRAAEDQKLFAYEALLHEESAPPTQNTATPLAWRPHTWRTRIDLSALSAEDQATARATITAVLQHGLYFLGKTKAIATVMDIANAPVFTFHPQSGQPVLLTLQTPALLTGIGVVGPGANARDLFKAYETYFENASKGGLTLSHYYARQKLRGGSYQRHRFQGGQSTAYQPWLLTEAGAVFALRVKCPEKAQDALKTWLARGLPLAHGWSPDWSKNPYQPANGFGEIAVNQACHDKWAPEKKGITTRTIAASSSGREASV